eukprot:s66_g9.t2
MLAPPMHAAHTSSLTPRSFTPGGIRRLSLSPAPHLKAQAPIVMNQEAHSMQRSIADLTSGQDRVTSSIAALQMQVDRLMSTVEEISVAQEQMKKDLSGMMNSSESRQEGLQSVQRRADDDLMAQVKQELQDSLKAAEATLQAEVKRSINDAIAQQLVKEHMQQLDVQVRELSESFKPMIARIASLTAEETSTSAEGAASSEKGPSTCEEPQPGQSAQTTSEGPATTQATSPTNGTRSVQEGSAEAANACQSGLVLVDGCVSSGRRMLQGGEVVLLRSATLEEGGDVPSKRRGVPRMLLHDLDQEMQVEEHGENGYAGYAHFCRYYRDVQRLLGLEDWERCEKFFFSPVPWMMPFGGAMHVAPSPSSEEASAGEVALQDALSMLPACALDVRPGQTTLDLCSAPGSKTCQLLDALQGAEASALVANELLPERTERDGCVFPKVFPEGFDRILVDVPCSSDGTMRKEPKRLQRWKVSSALNHHGLQLRLLCRGLELLKPGDSAQRGRLVYSTCSLNPIENEAVVQAALLHFGGTLSLLPAEDVLPPGCPRGSVGLEDWFVPDPSFESTAVVHHEVGHLPALPAPLEASMFAAPARQLHLQRCARFWPIHGPYFGGFFLAAFTKTAGCTPTTPLVSEFVPRFVNVAETAPDTGLIWVDEINLCHRNEGFDDLVKFFGLEPLELQHWVLSPSGTICEVSPRFSEVERSLENLAIWQDGPLLVQVAVADCSCFWLSGDVVNGTLSLETPSDVLQRIGLVLEEKNSSLAARHPALQPRGIKMKGDVAIRGRGGKRRESTSYGSFGPSGPLPHQCESDPDSTEIFRAQFLPCGDDASGHQIAQFKGWDPSIHGGATCSTCRSSKAWPVDVCVPSSHDLGRFCSSSTPKLHTRVRFFAVSPWPRSSRAGNICSGTGRGGYGAGSQPDERQRSGGDQIGGHAFSRSQRTAAAEHVCPRRPTDAHLKGRQCFETKFGCEEFSAEAEPSMLCSSSLVVGFIFNFAKCVRRADCHKPAVC